MMSLLYLIPIALFLGGIFLFAFKWCLKTDQFDDLEGDRYRIFEDDDDVHAVFHNLEMTEELAATLEEAE